MKTRYTFILTAFLIIFSNACQSKQIPTTVPPQQIENTTVSPKADENSQQVQVEEPGSIGEVQSTAPIPQPTPTLPAPTKEPGNRIKDGNFLHSDKPRLVHPKTITDEMKILAEGNNRFTFDLYPFLQPKDNNFFYSPYSISSILAMAMAGARGDTAIQMADVLHITLAIEQIPPTFNNIEMELLSYAKDPGGSNKEGFILNVANSIWGQENRPFQNEYLDILSEDYGAGVYLVDFINQPDESRQAINEWVSQQTQEKIQDLFSPESITPMTRLVLANAIYFKAGWLYPFNPELTKSDYFFLLVGGQTSVSMMHNTETYAYKRTARYEVIELPYQGGGESMIIIMPIVEEFPNIEKELNASTLKEITGDLKPQKIDLTMPQFSLRSSFALRDVLIEMGMLNAFAPLGANFSGIDGTRDLYIDKLEHKTLINVDENGTEAAAASGAAVGITAADENPSIPLVINHPFIFVIQDHETGLILFIGRVLNPSKTGEE